MSESTFMQALVPSMFHRRLLLLMVLVVMAMAPLAWRLGRLTLVKGATLREDAERRLVRRAWTPTVRGTIRDRKDRVLAQDKPSYNVAVEYSVITGDWVQVQARLAARHAAGARWADMSLAQKEDEIARYRPAFVMHLDRGWTELAKRLQIDRVELDKRRDLVVSQVMGKQEHNTVILLKGDLEHVLGMEHADIEGMWDAAAKGEIDRSFAAYEGIVARVALAAGDKGKSLDASAVKAMVKKCMLPIAEVKQAQVLAWRVSDDVGFGCRGLADLETDVGGDEDTEGLGEQGTKKKDVELVRSPLSISTDVMPGLSVLDGGDREYPIEAAKVLVDMSTLPTPLKQEGHKEIMVDGLGAHVLGRIRDRVQREDPQRREEYLRSDPEAWYAAVGEPLTADSRYDPTRDRGGYHESDRVGDTGIEASQENVLRGLRGMQTSRLDNGEMVFEAPAVGKDVHLTIDMMLEARVQAAMSPVLGLAVVQDWHRNEATLRDLPAGAPVVGTALNGAAVVMDIDSGDILALVSMPSYSREQAKEAPETVYKDPLNVPFLNRAIAKPYPPGSIVKPLILNGAVQHGNYTLDQRIACTGFLFPNEPKMYRCWLWKQHNQTHSARYGHDLSGAEAIMASCNIFFFTMGKRLGPTGIVETYREFGVGDRFNLGVGQEFAGSMGRGPDGAKLGLQDAIQMGIGQGPISWTPLHAAAAYATLARGGVRIMPRLIVGAKRPDPVDIGLDQSAIAEALQGLTMAVNEHEGTGNHLTIDGRDEPIFNAPGVKIWGKTGTAAASPLIGDPDGEGPAGKEILAAGDHSWFVIMVGHDRPRYVISVVTDFGGSGGKVSGPICNQIIYALMAEGYL